MSWCSSGLCSTAGDVTLLERVRHLERAARPLEPGASRRRALRNAVVAASERFLRSIRTRPGFVEAASRGAGLLDVPIGPHGHPIDELVGVLEREVIEPGGQPASPGYLAYIPGGGLYHSALGDFLAAVTNKYAGVFFAGPGAVRMENQLVRWVADLVGYPAGAAGTILSGGSLATLTAITAARDAHRLAARDYPSAVVYLTEQAHHSIAKALRIAGMAEAPVRQVPMDDRWRMCPDGLAEAIAADRAQGLRPWLICAAAGTTDTGAVDPLEPIADIAERERCWLHVDAAYGGFFLLTEQGRALMRGIERSDSAVLDPHKGLFLPYGAGIVVVRDGSALAESNSYTGHYMQDAVRDPGEVSPADLSPELSRHFRALRMWLPLMAVGAAPFSAALEEKLLLARYFRDRAAALGFEVGPQPELSIVTFRWVPRGADRDEADRFNERLVDAVRRDGRVFLSSTRLDGLFVLRMAVLSFRTHRRAIDLAIKALTEAVAMLDQPPLSRP